jgi:photosystem II stability/assembly factor-like uncharacterized protein
VNICIVVILRIAILSFEEVGSCVSWRSSGKKEKERKREGMGTLVPNAGNTGTKDPPLSTSYIGTKGSFFTNWTTGTNKKELGHGTKGCFPNSDL